MIDTAARASPLAASINYGRSPRRTSHEDPTDQHHVDDPRAAFAFYTDVLGFTVRHDIPLGDDFWLTVVSPASPDGPELLLEPARHRAVKPYREALIEDGIPVAQFAAFTRRGLLQQGPISRLPAADAFRRVGSR